MKFRIALAFFSRIPVKNTDKEYSLDGILVYFPIVGAIIGLFVAISMYLFSFLLPLQLCAFLGCFTWVYLTGGLHLDGVSDCGDGLVVEASKEKRLEIMKDSCIGTFGAIALFFILSAKLYALTTLVYLYPLTEGFENFAQIALICCTAGVLSRAMNFVALKLPSAREGGLGDMMRNGLSTNDYKFVFCVALFFCVLNGLRAIPIVICTAIVSFLLLNFAKKRIGGITGDVLGCLTESLECAILFTACMLVF